MTAQNLVFVRNGQALTTSEIIADGTGNTHQAALKLLRTYRSDFEEFGRVGFEIRPFETAGGTQQKTVAFLNEQQATLLVTYCRNTEQVRKFKIALVKAFYEMRQALTAPVIAAPKLDAKQRKAIQVAIRKRCKTRPEFIEAWSQLSERFGVHSYVDIPASQFDAALSFASGDLLAGPSEKPACEVLPAENKTPSQRMSECLKELASDVTALQSGLGTIRDTLKLLAVLA